jgi:hypothetical protein
MEGLHIFSQTEIYAVPYWYIGLFVGLGLIFGIPSGIILEKCKRKVLRFIAGTIFTIDMICITIFGIGYSYFEQPTGKYKYTVSIDDQKVKLIEFYNKYDIVSQDGELWTIKDK